MRQFTDTEIKMAEKAEKIQKNYALKKGDYYSFQRAKIVFTPTAEETVGDYWLPELWSDEVSLRNDYIIFLPLEHQLWEMVPAESQVASLWRFHYWFEDHKWDDGFHWANWTRWQLLLAFVMHELYQKKWDSVKEEWVKE